MNLEELIKINSETPSKALLHKAMMECEATIDFYKERLKADKKPYWKGKILHQSKQKKLIQNRYKEIYGELWK